MMHNEHRGLRPRRLRPSARKAIVKRAGDALQLLGFGVSAPDWAAYERAWRHTTEREGVRLQPTSPWWAYWAAAEKRGVSWGRAFYEWTRGQYGPPPMRASWRPAEQWSPAELAYLRSIGATPPAFNRVPPFSKEHP